MATVAGGPIRVLIVDDNPRFGELAEMFLEDEFEDISVHAATSAVEGEQILAEAAVDCVVSDYQMPGRNGLEFLNLVRERDPALPFVLFTGKGSEEVASDAIAAGVTDYLQKRTDPEQFEELADRIERAIRERRTAEGLSEGDRILTDLVETLSGVVYRLRLPDERPTFIGGRIEALTGYDRAAFREGDVTLRGVAHEDDVGRVDREIETALEEGRSFDATYRVRTKSGQVRRVSNRGRGIYNSDGEPVAVEGFVLDRSDGTQEARMRELHAATRRLFGAGSAEEVARLTAEAARDILGYPINVVRLYDEGRGVLRPVASTDTGEGLLGDWPDYRIEEDRDGAGRDEESGAIEEGRYPVTAFRNSTPVIVDEFDDADRPVRSKRFESAMYLPLGEYGTVTICGTEPSSFEVTDREIAGVLADNASVALDRTAREAVLSSERDRLAALFENVPDPAVRVGFVGDEPIVEAINPAFESTFGYAESAVLGRSLDDLIVPTGDEEPARTFNEYLREGESRHAEVRRETTDGLRDFLLHVVPRSRDSATVGYAVYTDITERRKRERELARQNERLEEFASVVSHDLRNPLNVAQGQLEIARATGATESFEAVEHAHDRIESRIEGLLELARHGRTVGETRPVDLAEVSRIAWGSVETGTARLDLADGLGTVEADPDRLCQLFENLLSNAVTHGAEDPPESTDGGTDGAGTALTVTVGPLENGFYVDDDGIGLPPDERDRVFDPGYTTVEDGTGFGLAIVRSIAEAHGWSVAATEGVDGGTRFEFDGVEERSAESAASRNGDGRRERESGDRL